MGNITLTKHAQSAVNPQTLKLGAGAPEIEITPPMEEAGVAAMYAWYASDEPPERAVRPIYEAMVKARGYRNADRA